jgi:DNA invertase Pin-like site-specific DNA recombinase
MRSHRAPTGTQAAAAGCLRAVIYARYSSDNQRDASIDDQLRVCRTRVDRDGWTLVNTYADHAISGGTMLRPDYQAMLAAMQAGAFDVVVAESLDRFSRDMEHIAAFFKQSVFRDVRIHTLAEGDISELHVGLKGVMGALYLKDLADKTRRGLEGRIHAGRCTGSPPYGYAVVRKMRDDGELDRGLREIDAAAASVVRRIFSDYAAGTSPCRIARTLNAEGIPGPGGGIWYDTSIRGREKRRDGILRNALYAGTNVWRRRLTLKDPTTGARLRRDANPDSFITAEVPELRIIDDELWEQVQARLLAEAAAPVPDTGGRQQAFLGRAPTTAPALRQGHLRRMWPALLSHRQGLSRLPWRQARRLLEPADSPSGRPRIARYGNPEPAAHAAGPADRFRRVLQRGVAAPRR